MEQVRRLIDYSWPWAEHLEVKIDWVDFILQLSKEKYNQIMEYKRTWVNAIVAITNPASQVIEIPVWEFKDMWDDHTEMIQN